MKQISYLILIFTMIGCKDDEFLVPDRYSGQATALFNGESWQGWVDVSDQQDSTFVLVMNVFNDEGFLRESLIFLWLPFANERSEISPNTYGENRSLPQSFYVTSVDGGDAGNHYYEIDTTTLNYIEITDFNSRTGSISGVFQITLNLDSQGPIGPDPPDKLNFAEGTFNAQLDPIPDWKN